MNNSSNLKHIIASVLMDYLPAEVVEQDRAVIQAILSLVDDHSHSSSSGILNRARAWRDLSKIAALVSERLVLAAADQNNE